jgi:hypothetical protein
MIKSWEEDIEKFVKALQTLAPNSFFKLTGSTYADIEWLDDNVTQPTQAEIDDEIIRLTSVYDSELYARKRKSEYPTVAELTIALYDTDDKAALETKRAAVKTKWPKDNSGPVE